VIRTRSTALAARGGLTVIALALAAALLSACGTSQPGAAAVVGDRRISVAEVESATSDIAATFPGQDVAPQQVLFFLISGPYIVDAAAKVNAGVTAGEARDAMKAVLLKNGHGAASPNPVPDPAISNAASPGASAQPTGGALEAIELSDAGVAVYQANTAIANIGKLDQTTQTTAVNEIKAALAAAHITVNPRYGTFDTKNLTIVPASQDWMSSVSPSAAAQVPADGGQGQAPADSGQTPAPSAS